MRFWYELCLPQFTHFHQMCLFQEPNDGKEFLNRNHETSFPIKYISIIRAIVMCVLHLIHFNLSLFRYTL